MDNENLRPEDEAQQREPVKNRLINIDGTFAKGLSIGLGAALVLIVVFSFGVFVGEQKARFSYRWGERYNQFFGGPRLGMPGGPRGFFGGHGTFGIVIKKEKNSLVIKGADNAEKIILITKDTKAIKGREEVKLDDIKVDDHATVIGSPNSKGQIEAKLIRLFDPRNREDLMWPDRELPLSPPSPL